MFNLQLLKTKEVQSRTIAMVSHSNTATPNKLILPMKTSELSLDSDLLFLEKELMVANSGL
jgi:hypothetical protein